jgi:anti-sigma factor (TIGR02949 family)
MNCEELSRWIGPLLDGELDARNTAEVQSHLAACAGCQRHYEVKQTLSSNLRRLDLAYAAPSSLQNRISAALEAEMSAEVAPGVARAPAPVRTSQRSGRGRASQWFLWAGWPVALAASALLATVLLQQRSLEADDIVGAHVRSLLANHLYDVISTDHHTVKPWFAGKIDFSPPVPDLSLRGFELVGGRLDYVQRQPVAAVIYRKHGHIINVLAGLPGNDLDKLPESGHVQGYSLRSWRQAGLDLVAVSDIDPRELANLQRGFESPPPQTSDSLR